MPTYVFRGTIEPRDAELRASVRPRHLEYQRTMENLVAGPITDDDGNPTGSLIVFSASDRGAAEARVVADPYLVEGVITDWTLDVLLPVVWPAGSEPPSA